MKIPKPLLVIGLMTFIAGIILSFMVLTTAIWKPKSEVIAGDKIVIVSAGGSNYFSPSSVDITGDVKDFVLIGDAVEIGNNKFDFYILDSGNYWNWSGGESHTSYFEAKNVITTSFSIQLTKEQATSVIYFVVNNLVLHTEEHVKILATLQWKEKEIIAISIGGIPLGGIIGSIGFVLAIIGGTATLIFKPKPPRKMVSLNFGSGSHV